MKFAKFLIIAGALVLAIGCAKPPQTEIDAAKASLAAAQSAEAPVYAADAFAAAKSAVDKLDAEVAAQAAKGAMSRKYDTAKTLATTARKAADDAKNAAQTGKEQLKNQLTQELPALAEAIPAAQDMVKSALKVRALEIADAKSAFDGGKFADAGSKAAEAKQRLDAGQKLVQAAVDAAKKPAAKK
jgi:colicin import membrane protein